MPKQASLHWLWVDKDDTCQDSIVYVRELFAPPGDSVACLTSSSITCSRERTGPCRAINRVNHMSPVTPVVLVSLLIALPFHSQKCPSLDDKLYSHHSGYKRHPEKNVLAIFHPIILTTCKQLLWVLVSSSPLSGESCGSQQSILSGKTVCSLSLGCMTKPHQSSQGDVHTPQKVDLGRRRASLTWDRHWIKRACLHSFPVLPFLLCSM